MIVELVPMSATIRTVRVTFTVPDGVDDDAVAGLVEAFLRTCVDRLADAYPSLFAVPPAVS